jgi:3',5'-cyclic AMP phosphodiesterase CpdA
MPVLMHLSDLHFGAHDPAVCAAVQRLAQRLGVDMAVVSGDLTQRATARQFEQAARFVQGPCTFHAGAGGQPRFAAVCLVAALGAGL